MQHAQSRIAVYSVYVSGC